MKRALPGIAVIFLLAACASGSGTPLPSAPGAASSVPGVTPVTSPGLCHVRYEHGLPLPDPRCSPGAVQPGYTFRDICPHVNPALEAMRPTTAEKAAVYRAYGITSHPLNKFEIDHVDAISLLGEAGFNPADPTLNLFPELNDTPDPAMIAKYRLPPSYIHNSKDILELVIHKKVCAGTVPLTIAQQEMAQNWVAAYQKYVGPLP